MKKCVYILTWCKQIENLYGTTLVFKTLRAGFPNTKVYVVDNASISHARSVIRKLAQECNAQFVQLENEVYHHDFIEHTLYQQSEGTAIFVDPDICFWKNVESWNFNQLIAGRRIPKYTCEYAGCLTHPRLHTSFLWIPDVALLQEAIRDVQARHFEFRAFSPMMFKLGDFWQRFDTGGSLFAALPEQMQAFTAEELDAYDHLFCGTHFNVVLSRIRPDYAHRFERIHKQIQIDHLALKGAWRLQEEYFQSLAL